MEEEENRVSPEMEELQYKMEHPELLDVEVTQMPCLECGQLLTVSANGYEIQGVFNVFCHDKDCEDKYAWKQ